jgi:two-component system sensor histidine kinase FlrB
MTMYLDLLRPLSADGEAGELLDRAMAEAIRLDHFLQDFQIFAGLRPMRRESVDVREVVEEATEGLAPVAGVRVLRSLGERTVLDVDRRLLAHAVRNLVVNALDAVGASGLDMERIFDPLFTTKSGGTGLGLTIVQRVAEAHGASLEVRNSPGSGASFAIRWPAEAARP